MNEEGQRCLRLASLAAGPLGWAIGYAAGNSFALSLVIGVLSLASWVAATAGRSLWQRGRELHDHSGHWLLTSIAVALPHDQAPLWLEEMHGQLLERKGRGRRGYLANLVWTAPRTWAALWRISSRRARTVHRAGEEQRLVRLLESVLAPDGDRTTAVDVLHATGLSRLRSRQPIRRVPALQLARQLLSTTGEHLDEARQVARSLLATRERARVITLNLRRKRLAVWLRNRRASCSQQHTELTQLRNEAKQQADRLRAALAKAAKNGKRRYRRSRP